MRNKQITTIESEIDRIIRFTPFSIHNRKTYKAVSRFARTRSFTERCNHEYDCCGCMYAQYNTVTTYNGQIGVMTTYYYNH